mgnify:CR=1 FL=1
MFFQRIIACCLGLAATSSSFAETASKRDQEQTVGEVDEIEGVVRVVGPAATSELLLDPGSGAKGPSVCKSDLSKRISKLTNYTVKVKGAWNLHKGKKRCVSPDTFTVTRAPSGRDAIVGILTEQSGSFTLAGNDGKTHVLADVPDGLKKLTGKKVILDLKSTDNPAAKDEFKIVIYSEFPE